MSNYLEPQRLINTWPILIAKPMAISRLIYQLSMIPTSSLNFMNRVKDKMYIFIWNNKREKIKRKIMNQDIGKVVLNGRYQCPKQMP